MKSKLNRIAYVVSILALVWLATDPASAGFGVSGAILKAEVLPGETIRHQMTVRIADDGNESPLDFVAEVVGFGQTLSGGCVRLEAETDASPYSACDFLKVMPESFHLEPGSTHELLLEGTIPPDVGPGGRYALVEIKSLPAGEEPVGVAFAINVPILFIISGTELVETGEILDLKIEDETKLFERAQDVSFVFKNTGNHHYKARAKVTLKDEDGTIVVSNSTPLDDSSIIPTASRRFSLSLEPAKDLPAGTYYLEVEVRLEDGTILASDEIWLSKEVS